MLYYVRGLVFAAGAESAHEAASEALQLAQLRLNNCQPQGSAAAADANSQHGRSLGRFLTGSWFVPASATAPDGSGAGTAETTAAAAAAAAGTDNSSSGSTVGRQLTQMQQVSHCIGHVRRGMAALARLDIAAASNEAAAVLGHLASGQEEGQQLEQQQEMEQQQEEGSCSNPATPQLNAAAADAGDALAAEDCPGVCGGDSSSSGSCLQRSIVPLLPHPAEQQCFDSNGDSSSSSSGGRNLHKRNSKKTSASAQTTTQQTTSSSSSSSIMRVAQGAAYPLITSLRRLSSVFMSGLGSTTAVALGTGLGVLRLGLGVMKFLVQLGVFASGESGCFVFVCAWSYEAALGPASNVVAGLCAQQCAALTTP
jgi:hypothetical protein